MSFSIWKGKQRRIKSNMLPKKADGQIALMPKWSYLSALSWFTIGVWEFDCSFKMSGSVAVNWVDYSINAKARDIHEQNIIKAWQEYHVHSPGKLTAINWKCNLAIPALSKCDCTAETHSRWILPCKFILKFINKNSHLTENVVQQKKF